MSGTVCSYKGCCKSFSTDKDDVSFFKFPEDPKRRKKWMENCSCLELFTLNDRQLRLKRVCSDHFSPVSFISAETRNQLMERAVPLSQTEQEAAKVLARKALEGQKKRGRPSKASLSGGIVIKKERGKELSDEEANDKDQESEEKENDESEEENEVTTNDDEDEESPPTLKKQGKQLMEKRAIPLSQNDQEAAKVLASKASEGQKKRGRPSKASLSGGIVIKKEREKEIPDEQANEKGQESEEKENDESEEEIEVASNDNEDEESPPTLKKQGKNEVHDSFTPKGKVRPPKLTAIKSKDSDADTSVEPKGGRRKSISTKRMADLSVIDQVVNEIRLAAKGNVFAEKSRKRNTSEIDESNLNKRRKSDDFDVDEDLDISDEDEFDDEDDEQSDDEDDDDEIDEEEEMMSERANREFERFQTTLREVITLPPKWGMGGVLWDPLNKMKVIAISEADVQINGTVRLKRAVQIFEDSSVKILIDGIDMTLNFGVKEISSEQDVGVLLERVANSNVCQGVDNFEPDDMIYLPYAKKRGCRYYAEACPVIITKNKTAASAEDNVENTVNVCSPCTELQVSVLQRKDKEQKLMQRRRSRPIPRNLTNNFGKSLYGLLNEVLDDAEALKSDKKQERDAVLSKYSNEVSVINGEIAKPEKLTHGNVSVDEVSASFKDIVSRLGFAVPNKLPSSAVPKTDFKSPRHIPHPIKKENKHEVVTKKSAPITPISPAKPITPKATKKVVKNATPQSNTNSTPTTATAPSGSNSNHSSTSFSLLDGQQYEVIGEVEGSEVVQMVDMNKTQNSKNEGIEIIEVDDETMAKLTAQNSGMFFQNSGTGGIQVATLDPSDPNISQILKAINPQDFKVVSSTE